MKKNNNMEDIRKDKNTKIAYNISLVCLAVMVLGNMILPFALRWIGGLAMVGVFVSAVYVIVKLVTNSKNKSSDDENEAKKW